MRLKVSLDYSLSCENVVMYCMNCLNCCFDLWCTDHICKNPLDHLEVWCKFECIWQRECIKNKTEIHEFPFLPSKNTRQE